MREISIKICLMFMAMSMSPFAFGHVSLDYPVGEESFSSGETVMIQWTEFVNHSTLNWDLYFSSDGGMTWAAIELDIPHETTIYNWTVPEINTHEGVVKVIQDNPGMNYEHQCLNFTIMISSAPPAIVDGAEDIALECSTSDQNAMIQSWLEDNGGANATSSCSTLTWTHDYTGLSDGCGASGIATVVFTVTDECANSSTTSADLIVADSTSPTIENGAVDITVECDGMDIPNEAMTWLDGNGNATATDACGVVEWTNNYSGPVGGCGSTGAEIVIFTATDACGNTSFTSATLSIEDTTPPVVESGAQDITIECSTADQQINIQTWITTHGGAIASDLCGNVLWANDYNGLGDECGATGDAAITFTITDECGNSSTTLATLTIEDSQSPTIEKVPIDISVECDNADRNEMIQDWLDNIGGATASDLCSDVEWTNDYTEPSGDCVDQMIEPVTFTVTDECGNTSSSIANIKNTISTGIHDSPELSNVLIYPNPSSDQVHIVFESDEIFQKSLLVYRADGKLIWQNSGVFKQWDIEVGDFSSGMYFLKVTTENGSLIRKLFVE